MKRDKFVKKVAEMCGPTEVEAVHQLAGLPPNQRHRAAQKMGQAAADYGLMEFLASLIDENVIDELSAILPRDSSDNEAEELLKRLWARLLLMISPEARDVLYAHNQLRLMVDKKAQQATASAARREDRAYQTALENAQAVLASTDEAEEENAITAPSSTPSSTS
jgi:hypothetical protein